ncbi:MAG TPA: thioredoxin domain-containing protein [Longimicrobiales bacterium]|nr:thioredoxin domain-containing protein [Longimicrobiales bacterium]
MTTGSIMRRGAASLALAAVLAGCGREADGAEHSRGAAPGEPAVARADSPTSAGSVMLQGLGYDRGRPDAPVLVLEFSDFGCPYCSRFALQTLPQIDSEFIQPGTVRWKYVPFVIGMFPNGGEAARAAECAADQETSDFWRMHDKLYANQREWRSTKDPEGLFLGYAKALDLDATAFAACYDSQAIKDRIAVHNRLAERLGVQATPTFFVNGVRVQGALPMDQFRLLLRGAAAPGSR